MHLCHGLTADTVAAFEVGLPAGEIDRPPRQRPLLEDPPPLVKIAPPDVPVKIVHILAHVNLWPVVLPDDEIPAILPRVEKPVRLPGSTARREDAVGPAEDVLHAPRLALEVPVVPLDDAQRVDPYVLDAQGPRGRDRVLERPGQPVGVYALLVLVDVCRKGTKVRRIAPRVGQREVFHAVAWFCLV